MREEAKADDLLDPLRTAFADSLRQAMADLPAHQALQMADQLCTVQLEVLAGLRVTYRTTAPVDGAAIAEDWRRGLSLGEITVKHKVSRSAAYKYHPNKSARRAKAG